MSNIFITESVIELKKLSIHGSIIKSIVEPLLKDHDILNI